MLKAVDGVYKSTRQVTISNINNHIDSSCIFSSKIVLKTRWNPLLSLLALGKSILSGLPVGLRKTIIDIFIKAILFLTKVIKIGAPTPKAR